MAKNLLVVLFSLALFSVAVLAQDGCTVHNDDCTTCQNSVGCGFCGVYGQGYCMQGNSKGSTVGNSDISECPTGFWKPPGVSCKDPVRIIDVKTYTDDHDKDYKYEWSSLSIQGSASSSRSTFDVLLFGISIEDDTTFDGEFAVYTGYTSGHVGDDTTNVKLFGTVFNNIFEYVDRNDDGLDVGDLEVDPDWLPLYNITQFSSFSYSVDTTTNPGSTLWTATADTTDGKVSFVCRIGNGDWNYTVPNSNPTRILQINPYEVKCDIHINNWVYRPHVGRPIGTFPTLGLQGFVVSASFDISLDPNAQNTNALANGVVDFGNGVGFFQWDKTVNGTKTGSGVYKNYNVVVNDLLLPNASSPNLPAGTVFKTTIYTIDNNGDEVDSFLWDPISGINAVKGAPLNFGSVCRPEVVFILVLVCLSFLLL